MDKLAKEKEDKKQKIYNNIGILLIIGIIGGTGLLLVKNSGDKEPIKITEPSAEEQAQNSEVKGEQAFMMININTASQKELEKLDGIGPKTAEKIIIYREKNGSFGTIEGIMNVSGIGEGKFSNIEEEINI